MELKIIKTLAMLPGQASGSMAWGQNLFPTSSFLLIQSQRQECGDNCAINYRKLKSRRVHIYLKIQFLKTISM